MDRKHKAVPNCINKKDRLVNKILPKSMNTCKLPEDLWVGLCPIPSSQSGPSLLQSSAMTTSQFPKSSTSNVRCFSGSRLINTCGTSSSKIPTHSKQLKSQLHYKVENVTKRAKTGHICTNYTCSENLTFLNLCLL